MGEWNQDLKLEQARLEFEARYAEWLVVAPPDRQLPPRPTPEQQEAYERMMSANAAYTNWVLSTSSPLPDAPDILV